MAKVLIAELDVDLTTITKEMGILQGTIEEVTERQKRLKEAGKTTGDEFQKNSAQLKNLKQNYAENQRILQGLITTQAGQIQTVGEARRSLSALSARWTQVTKLYGENSAESTRLQKKMKETSDRLKELEKATGNTSRNVGNYKEDIQGALSGTSAFGGALPGAVGGLQRLGVALKALSKIPILLFITAIVAGLMKLKDLFLQNEEAADKFAKIKEKVGAALDVVKGRIVETTKAFKGLFQKGGLQNTINNLAKAWHGVDEEIRGATQAAGKYADMVVDVRKQEIDILEFEALRRKQIQELIYLTRDETVSFKERKIALLEAGDLEREILKETLRLQRNKVALAEQELANTPEQLRTDEQRLKLAQERANLLTMEAASLAKQREIRNRIIELNNKERAQVKAFTDKQIAEEEALIKAIEDDALRELEIDAAKQDKLVAQNLETVRKIMEARMIDQENELILMDEHALARFEIMARNLQIEKDLEIQKALEVGADISKIEEKYARQSIKIAQMENQAKLDLAASFFGNIATIVGKGSAVGKAAAIAETTINTYKAAQGAYSAMASIPIVGPILGVVAAAAAVAIGIANVRKILSTKSGLPGEKSGGSTPSKSTAGVSIPGLRSTGTGLNTSAASSASSVNTSQMIRDGVSQALKDQPPVLVLEDFENVSNRKATIQTESVI